MLKIKKDHLYLVTGGSGFLGTTLIKRILEKGGRVRSLARNEGNLIELKQRFPEVEIQTGDLSDICVVRKSLVGVTGVFHLAAFKHVGLSESQPIQCTLSNVVGTLNLMKETEGKVYDFILSISTDKAAQVSGVYGATKLLMERIIKEFESYNPQTQYRTVRYGNVLYSTGSVLCKWKELMQTGKQVLITDPKVTRFYWTVDQAVDSIFGCMEKSVDSTPYCPSMKAAGIMNLLYAMHEKYGVGGLDYKVIGLQPGENRQEKILDNGPYSNEVEQFSIAELKEMI
jgi:UDP-N-acetylglucosamine 4,6-dehydratase